MGEYSGNHPRFSKKQEERYDAKMAHDKDLTASARLHYLENDETHHPAKNLADSREIKDMSGAYNVMGDSNSPAPHKGAMKGDQSATHKDYAHFKDTDPHYHGHTGASHGDQSATHRDYMHGHPVKQSRVGQEVDGKTITWDPVHEDLGPIGRWANNLRTSDFNLGGGGQRPGDVLHKWRMSGGPKGSVNRWGYTNPGANLFPPENPIEGKVVPANPNPFTEGNPSGGLDNVFHDYNQDGTMLGRGLRRLANWWNR
tara:strand:- start:1122 stop:1889 length:768 start_codon:yes stop_codon:yes gene_type:complete